MRAVLIAILSLLAFSFPALADCVGPDGNSYPTGPGLLGRRLLAAGARTLSTIRHFVIQDRRLRLAPFLLYRLASCLRGKESDVITLGGLRRNTLVRIGWSYIFIAVSIILLLLVIMGIREGFWPVANFLSPFNIENWIVTGIAIAPGLICLWLAGPPSRGISSEQMKSRAHRPRFNPR